MLGRLDAIADGPGRAVALAFHVDYFNDPWVDPFSDPKFSRRESAYDAVYNTPKKRDGLYFTPMLMVDGRVPMLGTDEAKLRATLDRSLREEPRATIAIATKPGPGGKLSATVTVAALAPSLKGRPLIVALATAEGPLRTKVAAGENAGVTLVEHAVVREFAADPWSPENLKPRSFSFPLEPAAAWDAARCRLVAFVQDTATGRVYQAASIPLLTPGAGPNPRRQ